MATFSRGKGKGKGKGTRRPDQKNALFKRKKFCRFTVEKVDQIDYKDVDTLRDFIPISLVTDQPNILVAHPALPAKSFKELIALARSQPKPIAVALVSEWLQRPGSEAYEADDRVGFFRSMDRCYAAIAAWQWKVSSRTPQPFTGSSRPARA